MDLELINLELKFATKQPTLSEPSQYWEAVNPYEVMDDFKLATMLDLCFKLDWCQNDESSDVHDLLTSQVVWSLPMTPAEYIELELLYSKIEYQNNNYHCCTKFSGNNLNQWFFYFVWVI